MNAIGFLFNKLASQNLHSNHANRQDSGKGESLFQDLLLNNGSLNSENSKVLPQELESISSYSSNTLTLDMSSIQLSTLLTDLLTSVQEVSTDELELDLEQLSKLEDNALESVQNQIMVMQPNLSKQEKFIEIFSNFQSIIQGMVTEQDVKKAAPKVLELLQQWTSLEKSMGNEKGLGTLVTQEGSKEQGIWKDLLQNFQKRNQLAANQLYNTNSKVTTIDVMKWINHAIDKHSQLETMTVQQSNSINMTSMPMSKVEQYVIYVNQTNDSQPVDKQLVDQFQKVINSSRFTSLPNGANQLSISLRPDNLGEMMVKLTQINGEMTVKILVSSQATKEMLESNINQLKNMFSPHQVAIERQDINTQNQGQSLQKDQGGQAFKEQNDQQSGQSATDQNQQKSQDNDFESTFQELILNEGV